MSEAGEIKQNHIPVSAIHQNTELTLIQITEDKLRLVLMEHIGAIESKSRWQMPLGIFLALVPMFFTSDFKDFAFVEKATWKAFFMLATLGDLVWLAATIRFTFKTVTLDDLVRRVKNLSRNTS